jgi:hypothetical protein
MSQNNPEMDFNITDLPIPQQFAISNEDIQKIADAVKSKLSLRWGWIAGLLQTCLWC